MMWPRKSCTSSTEPEEPGWWPPPRTSINCPKPFDSWNPTPPWVRPDWRARPDCPAGHPTETVQTLRRALKAGARGFCLWPADRGELARAVARVFAPGPRERHTLGRVVAGHGPRGGGGGGGLFLWPAARGELARAVARVFAPGPRERHTLGRVVAVHGPRGGAGATFL